jgi:hypothetical protein
MAKKTKQVKAFTTQKRARMATMLKAGKSVYSIAKTLDLTPSVARYHANKMQGVMKSDDQVVAEVNAELGKVFKGSKAKQVVLSTTGNLPKNFLELKENFIKQKETLEAELAKVNSHIEFINEHLL